MSALAIATRHEIAGAGIEALLQAAGHQVVARCLREEDLLHSLDYSPDIIILAENIVGREAAKRVSQLRARNCCIAIIFLLEGGDTTTIAGVLDLHVEGILLSTACARTFHDCVDSVRCGRKWVDPELRHLIAERPPLTSRETNVADLILEGLQNKEIAQALHLSEGTVKMHLHHIYEKLHISGRTQLVRLMGRVRADDGNGQYR